MADIFISYSSKDRALAAHLAAGLEARGFSVFWDFNLIGGRRFRTQIHRELAAARAAIVIWTERSKDSGFVLVEAQEAAAGNKLLAVYEDGFGMQEVPAALREMQTLPLSDPGAIAGAITTTLCAAPATEAAPVSKHPEEALSDISIESCIYYLKRFHSAIYVDDIDDATWEELKNGGEVRHFQEYLSLFPDGRHSKTARRRIADIERGPAGWRHLARNRLAYPFLYSLAAGIASSLLLSSDFAASFPGGIISSMVAGAFLACALCMSIARFTHLEAHKYAFITLTCIAGYAVAAKFAAAHFEAHYYPNGASLPLQSTWLAVAEGGFYAGAIASAFIYIGLSAALKSLMETGTGVTITVGGAILGMLVCLPVFNHHFGALFGWAGLLIPWQSFVVVYAMHKAGDGAGVAAK
jgi:hypothetical protein